MENVLIATIEDIVFLVCMEMLVEPKRSGLDLLCFWVKPSENLLLETKGPPCC